MSQLNSSQLSPSLTPSQSQSPAETLQTLLPTLISNDTSYYDKSQCYLTLFQTFSATINNTSINDSQNATTAQLNQLYDCILHDIQQQQSSEQLLSARAAIRMLGFLLHHQQHQTLFSVEQLSTLCKLLQSSSDKQFVTMSLWVLSEQSLQQSIIEQHLPMLLRTVGEVLSRWLDLPALSIEGLHALKQFSLQCPESFKKLSADWISSVFTFLHSANEQLRQTTVHLLQSAMDDQVAVNSEVNKAVETHLQQNRVLQELKQQFKQATTFEQQSLLINCLSLWIQLLGPALTKSSKLPDGETIINFILQSIQSIFGHSNVEIRLLAFKQLWSNLIKSFAMNRSIFERTSSIGLLVKPILYRLGKETDLSVTLEICAVWRELLTAMKHCVQQQPVSFQLIGFFSFVCCY